MLAGGATQMAADETMLESALMGVASLRFYCWDEPTVSLGYFQSHRVRHAAGLESLPYVRRPTGGETLVHHHELTYALALPAGRPWQLASEPVSTWLSRFHGVVGEALARMGVSARQEEILLPPAGPTFCFHHVTAGDLVIEGRKIAGSAQRRRKGALLQHGAVLLKRSPHAPALQGILDLTGIALDGDELASEISRSWMCHSGSTLETSPWSVEEERRIEALRSNRYTDVVWNQKR
jgi:lipoate-protein ligase A